MNENEKPPNGELKMIVDRPWERLGLACTMYDIALSQRARDTIKESASFNLPARISWDEAVEFYRHTDPDWKKAISLLASGSSPEDAYKAIRLASTELLEFGEQTLRDAAPQVRYWCDL